MSNYRGGIDLMKLVGAKIVSIDVKGKPMNCVMIPAAWNDIKISADNEGHPKSAFLNVNLWETRENFRKACEERNADKDNYVAPSHELAVSYTEDFTALACAAAENRLRKDPKTIAEKLSDEEIKRQARYAVHDRQRVGTVTPIRPKPAVAYNAAAPAAPQMGGFAAQEEVDEELPF